ncbi:DUF3379 domain-containing protein [Psychromonas sp. MB-3u-54]|uniref:DUF3379 family protein n=1 Tax=Psychromonas sp. MB-3u-54 TaxID=2058319 RepID=UPI000C346C28|nr:DUF3379 family protein [Psychromonas sp. MB-3u-54]PKH04110.1 DUF3379 domain-containing protein [Psychromonas sp. MB-3u-54]
MDDILFRHIAIATPKDKNDEFLRRQRDSAKDKTLVDQAKQFDLELQSVLKVDPPDDMIDKILLEQSFEIENKKNVNQRWHLAIAASVAFIIGISLPLLNNLNNVTQDIGTVALQHMQQEYSFTEKVNEQANLSTVNAKLASYGGLAKDDLGDVLYVNHCRFDGKPGLHMIIQGEQGRITVFVVPDDGGLINSPDFHNQHLKGLTEKLGKVSLVIVGETDEPLEKIQLKLKENIQWQI